MACAKTDFISSPLLLIRQLKGYYVLKEIKFIIRENTVIRARLWSRLSCGEYFTCQLLSKWWSINRMAIVY